MGGTPFLAEQITFLCLLWLGWVRCVCMEERRFHSKKKKRKLCGEISPALAHFWTDSCTLTCKIDPNFIYSRKTKATMYTVIYPRVYLSRIYAKSNHIIISIWRSLPSSYGSHFYFWITKCFWDDHKCDYSLCENAEFHSKAVSKQSITGRIVINFSCSLNQTSKSSEDEGDVDKLESCFTTCALVENKWAALYWVNPVKLRLRKVTNLEKIHVCMFMKCRLPFCV